MSDLEKKLNSAQALDDNDLEEVSGGRAIARGNQKVSESLGLPSWTEPVVTTIANMVNKK